MQYKMDPKLSSLYILKYKEIIEQANKGSKKNAIELSNKMKKEGKILKKIGITCMVLAFVVALSIGGYIARIHLMSSFTVLYIFGPMASLLLPGGYMANRGELLLQFTLYIDTNREDDIFA